MLTASFIFAKGMNEEMERALWQRGITSWELARTHADEVSEVMGGGRSVRLLEALNEAEQARLTQDHAWFKANWPERESWRLWTGLCASDRVAFVDIETTGLTPGYDQITVIGLADGSSQRAFVAGRPQAGDEPLDAFRDAIRAYKLVITFNGTGFDVPFIEKHFRDANFRFDMPHLDLLQPARSLGLIGGLKDMEKQLGIARDAEIAGMRGMEAIQLWGAWKNGDLAAYRKLTTYCKADCANLHAFADHVYRRKWEKAYAPFAREVDFAAIKGQQTTLF